MKTSPNGIQFIENEEGVILYAYDDFDDKRVTPGQNVRGTLTIGTGHTSAAGAPKVVPGMTITKAQADQILANDLAKVEDTINKATKVALTQNQFDALVSFQFNTGGYTRSSVLRKLNAGDYQGAADALLQWSKANGNPTLLLNRRKRERALFLQPDSKAATPAAAGGAVAGSVVAGGTALATTPHNYWPWIIGGIAVTAGIAGIIYIIHKVKS